jgi:hypothetical protein
MKFFNNLDILIGNPYNNLFDPGFRGEVLELVYTQVTLKTVTVHTNMMLGCN